MVIADGYTETDKAVASSDFLQNILWVFLPKKEPNGVILACFDHFTSPDFKVSL